MATPGSLDSQFALCTCGIGDQYRLLAMAVVEGSSCCESAADLAKRSVVSSAQQPVRSFRLETSLVESAVYCSVRRVAHQLFRLADVSVHRDFAWSLDAVDLPHDLPRVYQARRGLRNALRHVWTVVDPVL